MNVLKNKNEKAYNMKVFTCKDHDTRWPVGGSSIIVAKDRRKARRLLNKVLKENGLKPGGFSLQEVDLSTSHVTILNDGDY